MNRFLGSLKGLQIRAQLESWPEFRPWREGAKFILFSAALQKVYFYLIKPVVYYSYISFLEFIHD